MYPDCSGNGRCSIVNGSCLCNKVQKLFLLEESPHKICFYS